MAMQPLPESIPQAAQCFKPGKVGGLDRRFWAAVVQKSGAKLDGFNPG